MGSDVAEPPTGDVANQMADGGPSASMVVAACEHAWADIQAHHPDLPDAVIVLGSGVKRGRLVKLGHWCAGRWLADGAPRGEVLVAGEALHLPPTDVMEVLLHEAAHGLNAARGRRDTSRDGRYHNQRFRAAAEEVGLRVRAQPPHGLAKTSLTDEARDRYRAAVDGLAEAMRIARQLEDGVRVGDEDGPDPRLGDEADGGGEGRKRRGAAIAACSCGRRLRMAPSVLAAGPVSCGRCGSEFLAPGVDRIVATTAEHPDLVGSAPRGDLPVRDDGAARDRQHARLARELLVLDAALAFGAELGRNLTVPVAWLAERRDALAALASELGVGLDAVTDVAGSGSEVANDRRPRVDPPTTEPDAGEPPRAEKAPLPTPGTTTGRTGGEELGPPDAEIKIDDLTRGRLKSSLAHRLGRVLGTHGLGTGPADPPGLEPLSPSHPELDP